MSRALSNATKVLRLLRLLGEEATGPGRVYLTGGGSAVIVGWRESTIDVDLKLDPEPAGVFGAISRAKETLDMNIELAAPDDFIPPLPKWRNRSVFLVRHGEVDFHHYDFHAQALSKIERGHEQDLRDVEAMFRLNLVDGGTLMDLFEAIEPRLSRYPAIDAGVFRRKVEEALEAIASTAPAPVAGLGP